jgi:integrase
MSDAAVRQAVRNMKLPFAYTPHATRTTGSTLLNEMGFRGDVIERQLAHQERDAVRRTYNHAEYLEERAQMMQHWADLLDELTKSDSKVVTGKFQRVAA